jgi:hypothetical protein
LYGSLQTPPRSPGSRAWSFQTCMGSATTQDRSATRGIAPDHTAFRFDDSVGIPIGNFRSSIPSPSVPLFTLHGAPRGSPCKTRGRVVRYSLLVRLLHPLLHAGLSRRTVNHSFPSGILFVVGREFQLSPVIPAIFASFAPPKDRHVCYTAYNTYIVRSSL